MKFLNKFHKEAVLRKIRKLYGSPRSSMSSKEFAEYMHRNLELAKKMTSHE